MFKTIRKLFGPTMTEQVDSAIALVAKLRSEAESERVKADQYTVLVTRIDPFKDHWSFAHARHKQLEHQNAFAIADAAANQAATQAEKVLELVTMVQE